MKYILILSFLAFLFLPSSSLASNSSATDLYQFITKGSCEQLNKLSEKISRGRFSSNCILRNNGVRNNILVSMTMREKELKCKNQDVRQRTKRDICDPSMIGDGFCDPDCNNGNNKWDGGDCCPGTCDPTTVPFYPCGSGGYLCKSNAPTWFTRDTKLCFSWSPVNAASGYTQCSASSPVICAKVNEFTAPYTDQTRWHYLGWGCRMQWSVINNDKNLPSWFLEKTQICFRWAGDGNVDQCGNGLSKRPITCASLNSYTATYLDSTDFRAGGCSMSWQITLPDQADAWMKSVSFCLQWSPVGNNNGQCGSSSVNRKLCAFAGEWTSYYRDNTNARNGACQLQWGIFS